MNEISKVIDSLNLPKLIIDKAEKLFAILFGKGLAEYGSIFQDNIRFRRFKNQLHILSRAQELLDEKGYRAKEISLKTLVPLIEYSSLEEEPFLQEKWSRLIASASTEECDDGLTNAYIDILNKLSSNEVKILDYIYDTYTKRKHEEEEALKKYYPDSQEVEINHEEIKYDKNEVFGAFDLHEDRYNYYLENLFVHGLLKWDLPEVDNAMKNFMRHIEWVNRGFTHSYGYTPLMPDETKLIPATSFTFTYLGINFVKACKFIK